jgi:uncharacterized repeat protein (TIGR01451 family)
MSNVRSRFWTRLLGLLSLAALAVALASCGGRQPGEGEISVSVTVFGDGRVTAGDFVCQGTATCFWSGDGGAPVTFEAVPGPGDVLVRWGGACSTFEDSCTRVFSDGDEFAVYFAPHALRLFLDGDGQGTFEISGGGIDRTCSSDCAIELQSVTQLGIQYIGDASRNELSTRWGGACSGSTFDSYCLVTVSGQTNVTKTWTHPPIAAADSYGTSIDTTLTVAATSGVLANDDDTPDDTLTARVVDPVDNGTLTLRTDGSFDYVPDPGWSGVDTFRYRVVDAFGSEDEADVTITVSNALLSLVKDGTFDPGANGEADPGETIDYTFTLTNAGNVTLTNVTLTDPLATVVGGPIASLAPGASDDATFTATYAVTQADIDAGEVINTATADSDESPAVQDDVTVLLPQAAGLSLVKDGTFDAGANGEADPGETIDYTFTITNTGNVTLTNITLSDPLAPVTGGPIASLAPGASDTATFTASYAVDQGDIDAGSVANTATADSDQTGPTADGDTTTLPQAPGLSLTKFGTFDDGGDGVADVGDVVSYTFTIVNTGNVTLTNVTLDDLDPLVTVLGGPIASLAVGATDSSTFTATYAITQDDVDAGSVTNTATADSDQSAPVQDDVTVPLPSAAGP